MTDATAIAKAMGEGFTFVCASCNRLHQARAKGLDGCMAFHERKPCAGPMHDGAYAEYEGPIPRESLHRFCFLCGKNSDGAVDLPAGMIGICRSHMKVLESFGLPGERPRFVTHRHLTVVEG